MLRARNAALIIAAATAAVALLGSVLIHLFDGDEFEGFGSGLWFSLQTITSVGYGDHVPRSLGGRAVASLVMVTGIAFVSVITAAITAAFVESARRRHGRSPDEEILERLAEIERKLDELHR